MTPTIAPRLRRVGPDRRIVQVDPWPSGAAGPTVVLERDRSGWVRTDLPRGSAEVRYRTLTEARRAIACTNVSRWVSSARRADVDDPDATAFDAWVSGGLPVCPGVVRDGGWTTHDGCCLPVFGRTMPDGADIVDLYVAWREVRDGSRLAG